MVSEKNGRRYTPRFKFQVVMEILSGTKAIQEYEKRIEDLERLIGHKEVEIALLKNFMAGSLPRAKKLS